MVLSYAPTVVISLALASITYYLVEKPAMSLKGRSFGPKAATEKENSQCAQVYANWELG
jgi:peptidoglycan/LPS O-acetylase OafA/YrhL